RRTTTPAFFTPASWRFHEPVAAFGVVLDFAGDGGDGPDRGRGVSDHAPRAALMIVRGMTCSGTLHSLARGTRAATVEARVSRASDGGILPPVRPYATIAGRAFVFSQ